MLDERIDLKVELVMLREGLHPDIAAIERATLRLQAVEAKIAAHVRRP